MPAQQMLAQGKEFLLVSGEPCWLAIVLVVLVIALLMSTWNRGGLVVRKPSTKSVEQKLLRPPSFAAEVKRRTSKEKSCPLPIHQSVSAPPYANLAPFQQHAAPTVPNLGSLRAEKRTNANQALVGCLDGALKAVEDFVSDVKTLTLFGRIGLAGSEVRKEKATPEPGGAPTCPARLEQGGAHTPCIETKVGENGDPEENAQVAKLRERISDLLDNKEANASRRQDVLTSIARYGGERSCLTRFLRAHGDINLAEKMFRATMAWREEAGVNSILQNPIAAKVWQRMRPIWPAVSCGITPQGNAVIYFRLAHMNKLHQLASEKDLHTFYRCWMEMALQKQREGASFAPVQASTIPGCLEVYDCQGCGLSTVKCLQGLSILSRVLSIGQKYYPENMHRSFFLNAPGVFEVAWRMVRGVLDERTQQRISIHKDGAQSELCQLLGSLEDVTKMVESISQDAAPDGSLLFRDSKADDKDCADNDEEKATRAFRL